MLTTEREEKYLIKRWRFETGRCYMALLEWLYVMTQHDLRKENWPKITFYIAQICPYLGFYGGFFMYGGSLMRFIICTTGYSINQLSRLDFYIVKINRERDTEFLLFREINTKVLYFQIWHLKNADRRNFLLIFIFPITLLSLLDPCKLCPILL